MSKTVLGFAQAIVYLPLAPRPITMADIFAVAAGDSSSDEGLVETAGSAVVPPQEVASDVRPVVANAKAHVVRAARAAQGKNACVRKSRPPAAKSKLVKVEAGTTFAESRWLTVFAQARSDAGPKRQRVADDVVPITLWPLYTIPTLSEQFVVVSPSEPWLAKLLHTLRLRKGDQPSRVLTRSLWEAIRVMLRKCLGAKRTDQGTDDADDDDAQEQQKRRPARSFSGLSLDDAFLVDVTIAGYPLKIANSGRELIVAVDENCFRFISEALTTVIGQLSDTQVSAEDAARVPAQVAPFRFDDSLPATVRDKIAWSTEKNGWKVMTQTKRGGARSTTSTLADARGESFCVDTRLTASEHERAKRDAYSRAIAHWNATDQSTRHRIAPLLIDVELTSSSPSKSDAGGVGDDLSA